MNKLERLAHGFSVSEGAKLFDEYERNTKTMNKAYEAYQEAVSSGNKEEAASIKKDLTVMVGSLEKMSTALDNAPYDVSDYIHAGLQSIHGAITDIPGVRKLTGAVGGNNPEGDIYDQQADRFV